MSSSLLLADANGLGGLEWLGLLVVAVVVVFLSFALLLLNRYRRCPSNRVLVIYGWTRGGNAAKCVHGGAAFVWPVVNDYAYLSLDPIQIEVPLRGVGLGKQLVKGLADSLQFDRQAAVVEVSFKAPVEPIRTLLKDGPQAFAAQTDELFAQVAPDLGLPPRVLNALKSRGIERVGQVLVMDPADLLSIRNFGPQSKKDLWDKLEEFGYLPAMGETARRCRALVEERVVAQQAKVGQSRHQRLIQGFFGL